MRDEFVINGLSIKFTMHGFAAFRPSALWFTRWQLVSAPG